MTLHQTFPHTTNRLETVYAIGDDLMNSAYLLKISMTSNTSLKVLFYHNSLSGLSAGCDKHKPDLL